MKNNAMINETDKAAFTKEIRSYLGNNLNDYLIDSLSNILTIDYTNRLKKEPEINKYIKDCVVKLKAHLKHRIITEEDFSTTMSLFVTAITNKKTLDDELFNEQEKNQDVLVDGIISSHFGDLSPNEQKNIKEILKSVLAGSHSKEIMNFINSDPKLFYSVVFSAYKEKETQKEITEFAAVNLTKIINETKAINRKVSTTKSLFNKIALAASLVAVASLTGLVGGVLLPVLLAPAAAISIKLAPNIGTKLGSAIAQNNSYVQKKQERLNEIISTISSPELEQSLLQGKYLEQKKVQKLEPEVTIKPDITNLKRLENAQNIDKKNTRQR